MNPFSLDGQTALVTGANTGIGQAIAVAMARAGAHVICAGRSSCADTLDMIKADGNAAEALTLDFADPMAAKDAFTTRRVDILVNNAGIIRRDDSVDFSEVDWDEVMDVNLKAVFFTCQAFAKAALSRGGGKIVNIASLLSFQGGIRVPSYTASKHGVAGLTKIMANEWAAKGINVNAIAPGYIETNNTTALRADPDRNKAILERIPAGRWGKADDIAQTAVFLASPAATYIHGAVLNVDGVGLQDNPRLTASSANRPAPGIVHLGLGAFYRAHVASYLADLGGWGVIGVSLRSPSVRDALAPQDCVYTAVELAPNGIKTRQIEIIRDVLTAPENPAAVIAAMAQRDITIVSLTVTEKGYCHDPATGNLNLNHPDIIHDIASPLPRSAIGFLVRGLQARHDADLPAFTVMSCDNLPENGALTRRLVLDLAQRIDPDLATWIATNGAFPSAMVDRIVPATTPADIAKVAKIIGAHDAAPVMHEPFRQWVIEDNFAGPRPKFEDAGAQIVDTIAPFEHMKLRMLNGAHSAMAYLGYLAGYKTVSAAAADPIIAAYLRHLWTVEIAPTLLAPPDTDLGAYADTLLARFANTGIVHNTYQIAMDGSQKLPQRLLHTVRDRLDVGQSADGLLLAVAGWMRFTGGLDEAGNTFDLQDPMAAALTAAQNEDPAKTARNLLAINDIFDPALAAKITPRLTALYSNLAEHGAKSMMKQVTV